VYSILLRNRRAVQTVYPELSRFACMQDGTAALRRVLHLRKRSWRWQLMRGVLIACWAILVMLFIKLAGPAESSSIAIVSYLVVMTAALVVLFGVELVLTRGACRRALREVLAASGVRVCLGCGHDLAGPTGTRCPQCGAVIRDPA